MATKRDKRVAEISEVQKVLPDIDYVIEIVTSRTQLTCISYYEAVKIVQAMLGLNSLSYQNMSDQYLFASYITDKQIAKTIKIRISSFVHKNFKTK